MKAIYLALLASVALGVSVSCGSGGYAAAIIHINQEQHGYPSLTVNNRPLTIEQVHATLHRIARISTVSEIIVVVGEGVHASYYISLISLINEAGFTNVTVYPVEKNISWRTATSGVYRVATIVEVGPEGLMAASPEYAILVFDGKELTIEADSEIHRYTIDTETLRITPVIPTISIDEYEQRLIFRHGSTDDASILHLMTESGYRMSLKRGYKVSVPRVEIGDLQ